MKVRSNFDINSDHISAISNGEIVHIYGKEDNWYIIRTENNIVGCVNADYIEIIDEAEDEDKNENNDNELQTVSDSEKIVLSQDEQIFFNLINNKRIENNLPEFEIDENLLNLARLKANDIVEKNYFSHTSPTYGTFFEMLANNNIKYTKASENIAKGLNSDEVIENLMNSETHKNNILSQDFNYTGIGVVNSIYSGKIFVQMFISN